jgi:hypothetical protein
MATTTNYSWSTPDDTALVKDGAAAIRTLGSSADTTVKALNPGTTAGDIDYYTTSTAKARVAIGTAGQVLQVNSGATAPEWTTLVSGATFSGARVTKSASQTLTSGTWTIVSFNTEQFDVDNYHDNSTNNSRLTIPAGKSGYFLVYGSISFVTGSGGTRQVAIVKNGNDIIVNDNAATSDTYPATRQVSLIVNAVATDYFELNVRQDSGGNKNINGGSDACNFMITYLGA